MTVKSCFLHSQPKKLCLYGCRHSGDHQRLEKKIRAALEPHKAKLETMETRFPHHKINEDKQLEFVSAQKKEAMLLAPAGIEKALDFLQSNGQHVYTAKMHYWADRCLFKMKNARQENIVYMEVDYGQGNKF